MDVRGHHGSELEAKTHKYAYEVLKKLKKLKKPFRGIFILDLLKKLKKLKKYLKLDSKELDFAQKGAQKVLKKPPSALTNFGWLYLFELFELFEQVQVDKFAKTEVYKYVKMS